MLVKAASIAKAIMGTYSGAAQALAEVPYPYNFAAAASVIAFGMAQVSQIMAQKMEGSGTGAGAAGGVGVPVASSTTAPVVDTNPPGYETGAGSKGQTNIYIENMHGEESYIDYLVERINEASGRDVYIRRAITAREMA